MKKILLSMAACAMIVACSDENTSQQNENSQNLEIGKRACYSAEHLEKQLASNPEMKANLNAIEASTEAYVANALSSGFAKADNLGTITIPVWVNVIYRSSAENVSTAQINSQIDALNKDFTFTNTNKNIIPTEFIGRAANTQIVFTLAGVTRRKSSKRSWGQDDRMKSSRSGGINPTNPAENMNLWVCVQSGGILGYAQFPGGPLATDGVVITTSAFGTIGTATAPFDGGRTATHEVGHYLNLRHIWGDGGCTVDDGVTDTPTSSSPNYGCPVYPTVKCNSNDMTMNYMDYVDDDCMAMFTTGQTDRMRALFQPAAKSTNVTGRNFKMSSN